MKNSSIPFEKCPDANLIVSFPWPNHAMPWWCCLFYDKTFKVNGTSNVIIIASYWYCNLSPYPSHPTRLSTDIMLMIDWSMTVVDWLSIDMIDAPSHCPHENSRLYLYNFMIIVNDGLSNLFERLLKKKAR